MLRIVSKCSTEEDFVAVFRRFSDRDSLYVPTPSPKPVGTETRFLITLAGGEPMLAGAGEVIETNDSRENSFGRPGMKLSFKRLDDKSKRIVARLASARDAAQASPPGVAAVSLGGTAIPLPRHIRPKPRPGTVPPASAELAAESEAVRYAEVMREAQRAPGATDVLPANPFGELTTASLEAFIECTLYEETGSIRIDNTPLPGAVGDNDLPVWWPRGDQTPSPKAAPAAVSLAVAPVLSATAAANQAGTSPISVVGPDAAIDALGDDAALPEIVPLDPFARPAVVDPTATPTMVPLDSLARSSSLAVGATTDLVELPSRRPLWKVVAVTAAATSIFSFVVGYWWFGQRKKARAQSAVTAKAQTETAPATDPITPTAPSAPPPVDVNSADNEDETVVAAVDEHKSPANDGAESVAGHGGNGLDEDGPAYVDDAEVTNDDAVFAAIAERPAPPSGGNCKAHINSNPTGAIVSLGSDRVGETPFEASLPCGKVTLNFVRARYQDASQEFEVFEGGKVSAKLERPSFRVTISSSPAGASVRVGGQSIGKTPITRTMIGFEKTKISISMTGYKSYSTTHYAKGNGGVKATLTAIKPPSKPVKKKSTKRPTK